VKDGNVFTCANSSGTTVTAFDDASDGQAFDVIFTTGNTTLQDGANLQLSGSTNYAVPNNSVIGFRKVGTIIYETRRSND
jgi:hypothetical protein